MSDAQIVQALNWLEKAMQLGFINYPLLAMHDPLLESLRGDPGFARFHERVRPRWEAFEAKRFRTRLLPSIQLQRWNCATRSK